MLIRIAATVFLFLSACATISPTYVPEMDIDMVVVKSVRLPDSEPWYSLFATHTWIELHQKGEEEWLRIEANTSPRTQNLHPSIATHNVRWGRDVELIAVFLLEDAAAMIPQILESADRHAQGFEYRAYPGPNSNTYVARILDDVPGMDVELPHNAVGKDYAPIIDAGITDSRDGLHLDIPLLGASLGYQQGIELHLIGLTAGFSLWPPALKIPFLPRIGFSPGLTRLPE
jgi:hypothetical protein